MIDLTGAVCSMRFDTEKVGAKRPSEVGRCLEAEMWKSQWEWFYARYYQNCAG